MLLAIDPLEEIRAKVTDIRGFTFSDQPYTSLDKELSNDLREVEHRNKALGVRLPMSKLSFHLTAWTFSFRTAQYQGDKKHLKDR